MPESGSVQRRNGTLARRRGGRSRRGRSPVAAVGGGKRIDDRPQEADMRSELGYWEDDSFVKLYNFSDIFTVSFWMNFV